MASTKFTEGVFERSELTYTSCYCEENIYCMIRDHIDPLDRRFYTVVFISNEEKCTPLFHQKAAKHPQIPVFWDYHVILIHKPATETPPSTVYDFDTALEPFGLPFEVYVSKTLYGDDSLWSEPNPEIDQEELLRIVGARPRLFKWIGAGEYIRLFASTRKHMMKGPKSDCGEAEGWENEWLAKPPDYLPIRTEESDNTLGMFLDFSRLDGDEYGEILDERAFWQEFTGTAGHDTGLTRIRRLIDSHDVLN